MGLNQRIENSVLIHLYRAKAQRNLTPRQRTLAELDLNSQYSELKFSAKSGRVFGKSASGEWSEVMTYSEIKRRWPGRSR